MKDQVLDIINAEIKKQQALFDTLPEDDKMNRAYNIGKRQALLEMWLTINEKIQEED